MSREPHEIHNELAPEIINMIAREVDDPVDIMVLIESILAGLCMFIGRRYQKDPIEFAEISLESLAANLPERLKEMQKRQT